MGSFVRWMPYVTYYRRSCAHKKNVESNRTCVIYFDASFDICHAQTDRQCWSSLVYADKRHESISKLLSNILISLSFLFLPALSLPMQFSHILMSFSLPKSLFTYSPTWGKETWFEYQWCVGSSIKLRQWNHCGEPRMHKVWSMPMCLFVWGEQRKTFLDILCLALSFSGVTCSIECSKWNMLTSLLLQRSLTYLTNRWISCHGNNSFRSWWGNMWAFMTGETLWASSVCSVALQFYRAVECLIVLPVDSPVGMHNIKSGWPGSCTNRRPFSCGIVTSCGKIPGLI